MSNKALRILIADEQHFQRMRIERLFNQLNYYRVAPVHSLEELLTLVEYGCEPFDLVVINASMAGDALDLLDFFRDNAQVRHAFIYEGQRAELPPTSDGDQQNIQVSHTSLPDLASISRLMSLIDRRLPSVGTGISVR
ncbi:MULTISPECIES: chemotaxis protein CheY [Pseudomonas]|uniref:Response regulator n=1 Tax=Pseudomonas gregormendelii TaxID=1628277 RepID=A0ABS3AED6_9PSED|nr:MULTISPECIES: chemotaxis protein CheY [Pseudomonas]KJH73829.1 chemotaxis protein CheY [Pseudomonas sp. ES3-33]MBN3965503.1 response regulator [Pseudomonas gregormendelii]